MIPIPEEPIHPEELQTVQEPTYPEELQTVQEPAHLEEPEYTEELETPEKPETSGASVYSEGILLQEKLEESEKPEIPKEGAPMEKREQTEGQEQLEEPGNPEKSEQSEESGNPKGPEQPENPEQMAEEPVEPQIPDCQKKAVSLFRFASGFFHSKRMQNPKPEEPKQQIRPAKENRITMQDNRMILYAPERCLFLTKNGNVCYGLADHVDSSKTYRNRDRSAYVLPVNRNVYDLLTVRYDSSLFTDLKPEEMAFSRKIMQWIYEHSLCTGNGLPLSRYVDYQAYYSLCAEQFLVSQEKERLKRLQAELVAGEIAELAILYNRMDPEDIMTIRDTYIRQISGCELEEIRMLLDDILKTEVSDTKLKERVQNLKRKAENVSAADLSVAVQSPACEKVQSLNTAVHSNTYPGTVEQAEEVLDQRFFDEVRNMRLLLKKEDINGDMEIKTASFHHISYLVKQFYIMLSYSRELGIDYHGQHIWLIRYDSERRMPVPVMSMYEKHIRHLDRGKAGTVICYVEQKYQYLLEMYAGMNE